MKNGKPTISVVITCYNYGKYLSGALDSVLSQSLSDYEIVLVNDGSTDDTDKIVRSYLRKGRFVYVKQENKGQARAKNVGILRSRGRFVAFLDADDLWAEDKLEKQMALFDKKEAGVVYSGLRYIDEEGNKLPDQPREGCLAFRSGYVVNYLFMDNFVPFSASIVRRECFEKVGLFDETLSMGIDWDLWLRISVYYKFEYVDEPLLIYRKGHTGQMSKNTEVRHACSDIIMDKFLKANPELLPKEVVRKAYGYTYCNRGYYYRHLDPIKALKYYFRAIKTRTYIVAALKGVVKTVLLNFPIGGNLFGKRKLGG